MLSLKEAQDLAILKYFSTRREHVNPSPRNKIKIKEIDKEAMKYYYMFIPDGSKVIDQFDIEAILCMKAVIKTTADYMAAIHDESSEDTYILELQQRNLICLKELDNDRRERINRILGI